MGVMESLFSESTAIHHWMSAVLTEGALGWYYFNPPFLFQENLPLFYKGNFSSNDNKGDFLILLSLKTERKQNKNPIHHVDIVYDFNTDLNRKTKAYSDSHLPILTLYSNK